MPDRTTENRIEHLEKQISAIRTQRTIWENSPSGVAVSNKLRELYATERQLTAELRELRPYAIVDDGPGGFLISYKGDFVLDATGKNWRTLATEVQAQNWIAGALAEVEVAA